MAEAKVWPQEGYRPEWLALEAASGGRYQMDKNLEVSAPAYNGLFTMFSGLWPQYSDELEILNETAESCNNTGVRIYKPKNASDLPLIVFIHGGGLIAGNLDTEDAQCRHLAAKTPCIVMSIDYPKVTTSGVVMDTILQDYCIPAIPWCRKRGQELGANVSKTVLCGGSMGSTLSAATAYHYIQKGDTESITGLILPFTVVFPYDYQNERYTAWKQYGDGGVPILSLDLAKHIWSLFEIDFKDPRYLPGLAEDLSEWPPTYIISAEKDVCRDDGILFNENLQRAGRKSKLDFFDGLPHYFHLFPQIPVAHEAMNAMVEGVHFVNGK